MAIRARAEYEITAKDNTDKAVDSVKRNLKSVDDAADSVRLAVGAMGAATALVMGALTTSVARTTISFEKLQASLITVTGSAEAADLAFDALKDFAAQTPFQLEEVVQSFIKLKALGLEPSEEALRSYGNTASAMGKSLDQFIEAVADAATGEFERLKEFGIKASSQGDQVAFTFRGITTTVGKNAEEIESYLRKIGQTDFAGAMALQMETLGGAVSNMEDSISLLFAALGEAGLSSALKDAANFTAEFAKQLTELTNVAGESTTVLEGLQNAFGLLVFGTGSPEEQLGKLLVEMDNLLILEKKLLEQSRNPLIPDFLSKHHLEQTRAEIIKTRSEIEALQELLYKGGSITSSNKKKNNSLSSAAKTETSNPVLTPAIVEEDVAVATKYWQEHDKGLSNTIPQWQVLDDQVITFESDVEKAAKEAEKLNDIGHELGLTFTSAFEDAVLEGEGLRDVLGGIFKDISRIILRKGVTEPIASAVSSFDFGSIFNNFLGSFDVGTPYVPRDGLAYIHKGEAIIPASQNKTGSNGNVSVTINIESGQSSEKGTGDRNTFEFGRELANMVASEVQRQQRVGGNLNPI